MRIGLHYAVTTKPGKADVVLNALKTLAESARSAPGLLRFELMQSQSDPSRFVIIEDWASIEHHQAGFANLPKDLLHVFMDNLTEEIKPEYFDYRHSFSNV